MNRTVSVMDATHSFGAGNPINWFHNPTGGDTGIAFNPEWTWQLSRHGAWRTLGSAYQESHNEIYAQESASQLVSWLRDCPRPLEGAAGIYDEGYGSEKDRTVTHRRRVLFIKPTDGTSGYWIVSDLLVPSDDKKHQYETLFHLDVSPDSIAMVPGSLHTVTKNVESSNFAICPVSIDGLSGAVLSGQEEPVLRGWQEGPEAAAPLPVASYTFEGIGTARALYVLYPIPEGVDLPIRAAESMPVDGNGIAARIAFADGITHHIVQADQPGSSVRVGDIETDGEAAWVAEDKSGAITRTILVRGTELKRNGEQIQQVRPEPLRDSRSACFEAVITVHPQSSISRVGNDLWVRATDV